MAAEPKGLHLLADAFLTLENEEECVAFLKDALTAGEIEAISQRLQVANMLSQNLVYNRIVEETGASTTTISRVNHCVRYGNGGYERVLSRLKRKHRI